jgi:hypothetical protein
MGLFFERKEKSSITKEWSLEIELDGGPVLPIIAGSDQTRNSYGKQVPLG